VDEEHGLSVGIAGLLYMQSEATPASDRMYLHDVLDDDPGWGQARMLPEAPLSTSVPILVESVRGDRDKCPVAGAALAMKPSQRVRYLRTADGVQLAWAEAGTGPTLVKAANWLTHLEHDWDSPAWRHWVRFLADRFRSVRYDERGCGMTDWDVSEVSLERWVSDLEAVAEAAGARRFVLLGISQGAATCVAYAARHPERVSQLVIYGGYARGAAVRGSPRQAREFAAIVELARLGWGRDLPACRTLFTSRFMPEATNEQVEWFSELCRRTTSPEMAGEILERRSRIDVTSLLERVRAPTLVLHARDDAVVPLAEGRLIAARIPSAQFVELDSRNHILLEHEDAWQGFRAAVTGFLGMSGEADAEDPAFATLSRRERAILGLITEGLSNATIADRLSLSEKTVRNHVSHVFDKLGVWSRAQAIVFARDRHFIRDQA
jgi:pimeloyl-ACP methyl ester carboxylesterase/DNA-binding CsgD family transcriptional regulator